MVRTVRRSPVVITTSEAGWDTRAGAAASRL